MISTLAHIDPNAQIGNNVTVEPFAVIHNDTVIGEGSHIMSHAVIMPGARIGKNCKIYPGAVIGGKPQDLKYRGENTTAEIGDNTVVRECVTINIGTTDKWKTVVGSNCLLMAYAHVAHDCIIGNNVILANSVNLAGHIDVGDYAIIGGMTGAHQFTRIGAHTYIAGQSAIRKDVPPFVRAAREPLSYIGINVVGLQRRGFTKQTIDEISKIYHILFVQGHTTAAALDIIEKQIADGAVRNEILSFAKTSQAGIIRRFTKDGLNEDYAF